MTALPASTVATASAATEGDVKNFLTGQRDYLSGLFGDTGVAADARAALGVAALTSASIAAALGYTPASTTALAAKVSTDHGHGNIGSFVFAASTYVPIAAGSTESGSRLHIAGLRSDANAGAAALYWSAGTLSGTWRCLGYCVSPPSGGATATLWQRIS